MDKFKVIKDMSEEELIKKHDNMSNYSYGGSFFIEEYTRRQQEKSTRTIEKMTNQMLKYTKVITVLTIANVSLVLIALFK